MCSQKCCSSFQINKPDVWNWLFSSQADMHHHVHIPFGSTEPGFALLVSADHLALYWTCFGNLISKLPSPNYCEHSGPDPVGHCYAFLLPGSMFIIGPLFPDEVHVVLLGTGVVRFFKDPSCKKFPGRTETWNVLLTLHPQKVTLVGTQWYLALINRLWSGHMQVSGICESGDCLTCYYYLESWSVSNGHKTILLTLPLSNSLNPLPSMVLGCLAPAEEFSPGSLMTARYQVGLEVGFLTCLGVWRDGWHGDWHGISTLVTILMGLICHCPTAVSSYSL